VDLLVASLSFACTDGDAWALPRAGVAAGGCLPVLQLLLALSWASGWCLPAAACLWPSIALRLASILVWLRLMAMR